MGETSAMTTLLTMVGDFLTQLVSYLGTLLTYIKGEPYLMIGFVISVVSFAVGVLVRIARTIGHNPA